MSSLIRKTSDNKTKALVAGYIGGINVGDEAIAITVAKRLKEDYNCEVTVASGQPILSSDFMGKEVSYVETFYPGKMLKFKALIELIKVIRNTDILVFAGGGLLQDVHSTKLLEHGAFLAAIAKIFNKKVVSLGVGAGPVQSEMGKLFANIFMSSNDIVYFRDEYSKSYIEDKLLIKTGCSRVALDSILLAKIDTFQEIRRDSNKVGLCIRDWPGLSQDNIEQLVQNLISLKFEVTFIPYEKSDILLFDKLYKKFGNNISLVNDNSFEANLLTIHSLRFLISMRLHANLFAALLEIPFVALAYDNKLRTVFSSLGYESNVSDLNFSVDDIIKRVINSSKEEMQKLDNFLVIQNRALEVLLNDRSIQTRKIGFRNKLRIAKFWINRLLIKPQIIRAVLVISPIFKPLIPAIIEKKLKKILGIDW